jgi:hypothetical protein
MHIRLSSPDRAGPVGWVLWEALRKILNPKRNFFSIRRHATAIRERAFLQHRGARELRTKLSTSDAGSAVIIKKQ